MTPTPDDYRIARDAMKVLTAHGSPHLIAKIVCAVRPVIEAEALERARGIADQVHAEQNDQPSTGYIDGWLDAADIIEQRIRSLIPPVTT